VKLIKILLVIILLSLITITYPADIFSQNKNLSIRLSVTKNILDQRRILLSSSSVMPDTRADETDRSYN